MNKGRTFKQIKKSDLDSIKTLLTYPLKKQEICKLTGRSYNTVSLIEKANNLSEYKQLAKEFGKKHAVVEVAPQETPVVLTDKEIVANVRKQLAQINEMLEMVGL